MKRSIHVLVVALGVAGVLSTPSSSALSANLRAAIYAVRADGEHYRLVVEPNPPVSSLVRSPDGQSILFARETGDDIALYASESSGANPVRLTPPGLTPSSLLGAFSPDGRTIAFSDVVGCGFRCGFYTLYLVGRDGSGLRRIGSGAQPSWASDGRRLAYTGSDGVYVLDVESGESRQIAPGYRPIWAPRGERIAYNATLEGYGVACFVNANGARPACKTGRSIANFVWSPDGRRVAFKQTTPQRLGIMDSNGRHVRYLGDRGRQARPAAWSPDEERLAFWTGLQTKWLFVLRLEKPMRAKRIVSEPNSDVSDLRWRGRTLTYVVSRPEAGAP